MRQEFHAQQKLHCMVTQKTLPQVHHISYTIDIRSITTQGVLTKHVTKVAFVYSRGMDKFNSTISSFDNSSDVSNEGENFQDLCNKEVLSPSMYFNFPKSSKNVKPQICNIVVLESTKEVCM